MKLTAIQFGQSLDQDNFEMTKSLLSENCIYELGSETLIGPENIVSSYEQNMIAGRIKMDKLEWGKSSIDALSASEFIVNFTDYLYHNGEKYTHCCQQQLIINENSKICKIVHIQNKEEQSKLATWYDSVGIPEKKD